MAIEWSVTKNMLRIVHAVRNFSISALTSCQSAASAVILLSLLLGSCKPSERQSAAAQNSPDSTIRLIDAVGDTVVIARPARRIVSLAPNLTEMIFAIGAGHHQIARTDNCNYPPQPASIPSIGDYQSLNYERLLSMKPDLILMTYAGNTRTSYEKLKEIGLRPFVLESATLNGVIHTLDTVGILAGEKERGSDLANSIQSTVDSIRTLASTSPAVETFIIIYNSPLMTVSRGFLDEAVTIAGGTNIAAGAVAAYPTYNREELVRRDPEVIIMASHSFDELDDLLRIYPECRKLRAVRNNRVYILPPDIILRPGPRIRQSVLLLYQALHGADPHALLSMALAK
jgi:iron complex transport system substrate-binding protein